MELNIPEVVAELTTVFRRYEVALVENDLAVLDELFFQSPSTIRYGAGGENLYGIDEVRAYRASRPNVGLDRRLDRTVINTYGRDFGIAATLFYRDGWGKKVGRQMQTWMRTEAGWRVVAAHVSVAEEPAS